MTKYSKYLNEAAELERQDKRTADAVLTALENDVARDTYKRITQHISGKAPKQSHLEAKQQLLADILSLPCLQDEGLVMAKDMAEHWGLTETGIDRILNNGKILGKNELRKELRKAMTAYFIGGDVGVDMGAFEEPTPQEQVGGKQVDTLSAESARKDS